MSPGTYSSSLAWRRSRRRRTPMSAPDSRRSRARTHAAPRATMYGTFSVPARRPAFVLGSVDQRLERCPGPDVERADSFRGVQLVAGQREQVDPQFVDGRPDFADRLRGIGVHRDPALSRERRDLLDRLERPDLVVGVHDADQDRTRLDRAT